MTLSIGSVMRCRRGWTITRARGSHQPPGSPAMTPVEVDETFVYVGPNKVWVRLARWWIKRPCRPSSNGLYIDGSYDGWGAKGYAARRMIGAYCYDSALSNWVGRVFAHKQKEAMLLTEILVNVVGRRELSGG